MHSGAASGVPAGEQTYHYSWASRVHELKKSFAYVVLVGNIVVLEYVFYDLPLRDLDYKTPSVGQIEKIWQVPRGLDRLATDPMPWSSFNPESRRPWLMSWRELCNASSRPHDIMTQSLSTDFQTSTDFQRFLQAWPILRWFDWSRPRSTANIVTHDNWTTLDDWSVMGRPEIPRVQ